MARLRVVPAVLARLREVAEGLLNRLEWALRVELEGRRQLEPGRVAEGAAQYPCLDFTAEMMKKQPRRPV